MLKFHGCPQILPFEYLRMSPISILLSPYFLQTGLTELRETDILFLDFLNYSDRRQMI